MVAPILIGANFALNAGSAIAEHKGQAKASKANAANAKAAYNELLKDLGLRGEQEEQATAVTIAQIDRQARASAALARVGAAEAGVSGASVDALLSGIVVEGAEAKGIESKNLDMTLAQLQRARESGSIEALNRINAVPAPNPFATALRIGGAALNAGTTLYNNRPKKGE